MDSGRIMRQGRASRVIFYTSTEECAYIENPDVTLYDNGIVHIVSPAEETTVHLQNCEILWTLHLDPETEANSGGKVRFLRSPQVN